MINTLFAGASGLSNTFLNIYLWKLLRDLEQIAAFNFFIFFFTAIGFSAAGWLAKRTDRLVTLRMGVGLLAVFYILILLFGSRTGELYALLGSLEGIGMGFYWMSLGVLTFEVTDPSNRDRYSGINGFLFASASGIAPMIAGKILSLMPLRGYHTLFMLSLMLFVAAVVCTWWLEQRKSPASYDLYAGFRPQEHDELWHKTLTVSLAMGFREGTLSFLPFLLVFLVTKNELLAGRYLLVTSACSLLAYYLVNRLLTFERRSLFVRLSAIMLGLSVLWLLFVVNQASLFVFGTLNALFAPLLTVPYICLTYDTMGRLPEAVHRKVEYLVIREIATNLGRCLSLLALIASRFWWSDSLSMRFAFLCAGLSPLVALWQYAKATHQFEAEFMREASCK